MYCKKCGAKNEEDAKFCTECGTSLGESKEVEKDVESVLSTTQSISTTEEKKHDSIFRKALKKSAKEKPKGALCGMVLLQVAFIALLFLLILLSAAVSIFNGNFNAGSALAFAGLIFFILIVYFVFTMIISVGMMKASLAISRNEKVTLGSALKGVFQNFSCSLKAIGGMLLFSIGTGILAVIPFIGSIAALILQVYMLPVLIVFVFMALDAQYKDMSMGDIFHKAMELVKGHRVEYYGLMFSFIGWMLLAVLTLGLLYIWLMPYIVLAMSNWYLALNGEKKYDDGEKGLSNIAVIGIVVISYFAFIIVTVVSVFIYAFSIGINSDNLQDEINSFTEKVTDDNYDYNDIKDSLKDGKVFNMSGINVYVPSDYQETTMTSYDKIYKSPYGQTYIGTNSQDFNGSRDEFVQTLLKQYATMGFKCGTETVRKINNNEWANFECDYQPSTKLYVYLTQKNDKLYYLIVTDAGEVSDGKKLLGNIEQNLGLAY